MKSELLVRFGIPWALTADEDFGASNASRSKAGKRRQFRVGSIMRKSRLGRKPQQVNFALTVVMRRFDGYGSFERGTVATEHADRMLFEFVKLVDRPRSYAQDRDHQQSLIVAFIVQARNLLRMSPFSKL